MSSSALGVIIGGLLPAIAFGIGALFQKQGNLIGIGQSGYLLFFAAGILAASILAYIFLVDHTLSLTAGIYASAHGLLFGCGFVALAVGLTVYAMPISQLVPLANMSTLVSVVLGLLIFSEYTRLNVGYLFLGSVLIVIGGILVAKA